MAKLSIKETDLFVSIVNNLIETYCDKYPNEYDSDELFIGYDPETLEITSYNGDDLEDTLTWVNNEIIPDLGKDLASWNTIKKYYKN